MFGAHTPGRKPRFYNEYSTTRYSMSVENSTHSTTGLCCYILVYTINRVLPIPSHLAHTPQPKVIGNCEKRVFFDF